MRQPMTDRLQRNERYGRGLAVNAGIALFVLAAAAIFAGSAIAADETKQQLRVQMPLVTPPPEPERPLGVRKEPGPLRLGPVELHPYLTVKETYSDNVFFTSDDKKSDFITSLTPGIVLQVPFRMHTLSFNANTTFTRYSKYSSENTTDYALGGLGNFLLGSLVTLNISDAYAKGHEPRSSSSSGIIEKFRTNAAAVSLTYLLANVSKVQLDYTRTTWNYQTSEFRSRHEDLLSAYLYYRMLPKTSAFVEYDFKQVRFNDKTNGLDNKVFTGLLGLTWEVTERSKGTVKAGYLQKDFDDPSRGSLKTWTAAADVSHDFSDFTSIKLLAKRDVNESSLLGTRYFITTGLYGELTRKFLDRLAGVVRASYGEDKYSDIIPGDTEMRKDKTVAVGAGMRYYLQRWLEFVLDYNYRKRDSNIDIYKYTENAFSLTMNASF